MLFYIPDLDSKKIQGEPLKHFISMRKDKGDILFATDLKGNKAKIQLIFISKKSDQAEFEILEKYQAENPLKNILIQAQIDKIYQEKLVEILPHCKVKKLIFCKSDFSSPQNSKLDRLEKILIRSCEQAEICFRPEIEFSKKSLKELIQELNPVVLDFVEEVQNDFKTTGSTNLQNVLVGPEGGFSDKEKKLFNNSESKIQSLGGVVFPAWLAGFSYFQKMDK